jgi:hypothetical protein
VIWTDKTAHTANLVLETIADRSFIIIEIEHSVVIGTRNVCIGNALAISGEIKVERRHLCIRNTKLSEKRVPDRSV